MFEDFMEQAKEVAVDEIDVILYRIGKLMEESDELVDAFVKGIMNLERRDADE